MTTGPMDDWVPHRGAMSLLGEVEQCDGEQLVARLRVPSSGLFANADGVPAWIGLEYMAQAAAAWSGAQARAGGGAPRAGMLLGTRRYAAAVAVFPAGATLRVTARCETRGDNGLALFDCRIEHDGNVLATARLSVYETAATGETR